MDAAPPIMRELADDEIPWTLAAYLERHPPSRAENSSDLADMVADAILEAQSYRLLAQMAIHALYDRRLAIEHLQICNDILSENNQRLEAEGCRLRAYLLRQDGVTP
jgi:hypothetical protein